MLKKLLRLGALIMIAQLTTPVYSINHKLLDQEANSCVSRIWTGRGVPKTEIKDKLGFLYDSDSMNEKYTQKGNFKEFYTKITNEVKDEKFLHFAEECRSLRKDSRDTTTKIAVHLLLEKVTEKYTKELAKVEKAKALNKQKSLDDSQKRNNLFDIFLNADKSIIIK